jgi:hypothetical protein
MEIDQLNVAYYTLEPEVAGGLGDGTVIDTTVHPPHVERLHYEFEDWLGDDLVESFPCFLVSKPLAARLTAAGLGTFQLKDVAVTMTPEAEELLGDASFPDFYWFDVTGTAGRDDVGTTPTGQLVVSDQALALLREFNINNCDVEPFQP